MPNSLKCRLKKFVHKGLLSEKDLSRLYTDNDVIEELEKIKAEISKLTRYYTTESGNINLVSDNAVYRIINKHISELKGENNND